MEPCRKRGVPISTRDYAVGYKKPPIETRFKKGNNANPRGRPREPKDFASLLTRALDMPVAVVRNGKRRRLTKREAVIAQLVDRSAGADLGAAKLLLDLMHRFEPGAPGARAEPDFPEPDADAELFERLLARLRPLAMAQIADGGSEDLSPSAGGAEPGRAGERLVRRRLD